MAHGKSQLCRFIQQNTAMIWAEWQVPELLDGACVSCLDIFERFFWCGIVPAKYYAKDDGDEDGWPLVGNHLYTFGPSF